MSNQTTPASSVPFRVRIERLSNSAKWEVVDTIEADSVDRDTIPAALETWICRHGIANGDKLSISIDSAT